MWSDGVGCVGGLVVVRGMHAPLFNFFLSISLRFPPEGKHMGVVLPDANWVVVGG